ncbi:uncharacterized protein LOC27208797 [Drosophila simulans]|uniref:Major facilitator superfamily (MFS) profile domain-containing protein n=1 Tax=Drosophila simulans TaxID=7240 RepID=A0A0J9RT20_DROSI|nr:uncharacterized protein LOC27208797 [Drosophila simulans]KMY98817.1 uncharacterized protein Dsimw501_GD28954 [Drosophila simulans]
MSPKKCEPPPEDSLATTEKATFLRLGHKNHSQWTALGSASFILISGGMSLAWGAGFAVHSAHRDQLLQTVHMQVAWYATAVLGALFEAFYTHRLPQQPIYIFSSILVIASGILFLAWPECPGAIIAARYLDGLANGLVFVPALSTVGEISVNEIRGLLASTVEQLSFNTGILMQLIYTAVWQVDWNVAIVADQVHGVLSIVYGVIALALALTLCVESPVHLLMRSSEQRALVALRHLQRPYMVTSEMLLRLDEHKQYVATNREMCLGASLQKGYPSVLKLLALRLLGVLSLNSIVCSALYETGNQLVSCLYAWPFVVFGLLRWGGCFFAVLLMDTTGRKKPTLFGIFSTGAFAIAYANLFGRTPHMITALVMLFSLQFFAGLGQCASAAYLTEGFPLRIKPHMVAVVYITEQAARLLLCSFLPSIAEITAYFHSLGGLSMVCFLLGIFCLPETRLVTLAEAQLKFSKWFNKDF